MKSTSSHRRVQIILICTLSICLLLILISRTQLGEKNVYSHTHEFLEQKLTEIWSRSSNRAITNRIKVLDSDSSIDTTILADDLKAEIESNDIDERSNQQKKEVLTNKNENVNENENKNEKDNEIEKKNENIIRNEGQGVHRNLKMIADANMLGLETSIFSSKIGKKTKKVEKIEPIPKIIEENNVPISAVNSNNSSVGNSDISAINTVEKVEKKIENKIEKNENDGKDLTMGVDENGKPVVMKEVSSVVSVLSIVSSGSAGTDTVGVVKTESIGTNVGMNSKGNSKGKEAVKGQDSNMIPTTIKTENVNIDNSNKNDSNKYGNLDDNREKDKLLYENKLFYMYDLDEEFWWRWPEPEADCR